jgi:hypothetical protein
MRSFRGLGQSGLAKRDPRVRQSKLEPTTRMSYVAKVLQPGEQVVHVGRARDSGWQREGGKHQETARRLITCRSV